MSNPPPHKLALSVHQILERIGIQNFKLHDKLKIDQPITGVSTLKEAKVDQATFCSKKPFLKDLHHCQSQLIFVSKTLAAEYQKTIGEIKPNFVLTVNPRMAFDEVCLLFFPTKEPYIHPKAVIGKHTSIGQNCRIEAGVVIGEGVSIADSVTIYPNVTIYDGVKIGANCIIHSGTVIGSDGFGYELIDGKVHKQPQVGSVVIGSGVEIGSNCSIDRGAIGNTVIEDEVKIDNLVHIAHNVKIGFQTAIMGNSGIAGGTTIGQRCQIAGMVAINGHISIADGVHIHGHSTITKSIKEKGSVWASTMREQKVTRWSKNTIHATQLIELVKRVKKLETTLEKNLKN